MDGVGLFLEWAKVVQLEPGRNGRSRGNPSLADSEAREKKKDRRTNS